VVRQPPVWWNGYAATVNEHSCPRSFSLVRRLAVSLIASGGAAPIIDERSLLQTWNTGRPARTALRSGAPGIPSIGGNIARSTPSQSSGIANGSTFGTRNGTCAILQTTTQLLT
jgi:hypothetical protein